MVSPSIMDTLRAPPVVPPITNFSSASHGLKGQYPLPTDITSHTIKIEKDVEIYIEESGNPNGIPVIFFHGGPGMRFKPTDHSWFDPTKYRILCVQQRGTGQCSPTAENLDIHPNTFKEVTIETLVADMEKIRVQLGIDKWLVFGGSWGSTLSLRYAETHPDRCLGLVLRGIFLGSQKELDDFYDYGKTLPGFKYLVEYAEEKGKSLKTSQEFYETFSDLILKDNDLEACRLWARFENHVDHATPETEAALTKNSAPITPEERAIAIWQLQLFSKTRLPDLLEPKKLSALEDLPIKIVHGGGDSLCETSVAIQLSTALTKVGCGSVSLQVVTEGSHNPYHPHMTDALVRATDTFAEQKSF